MDVVIINPKAISQIENLRQRISNALPEAVILDKGLKEIEQFFEGNSPENVYLYGGDGSLLYLYNIMKQYDRDSVINLIGGGSGRYWESNLGLGKLSLEKRIELSKDETNIINAPLMFFKNKETIDSISYFDTIGLGDLGDIYEKLEAIRETQNLSSHPHPLIRRSWILASSILALPQHLVHEPNYSLKYENIEVSGIQLSVIPKILNFPVYNPGKGFSFKISGKRDIPLVRVVHPKIEGSGNNEIEFYLQGKVPMHMNGVPFTYKAHEGKTMKIGYEENAIRIIGLKNPFI